MPNNTCYFAHKSKSCHVTWKIFLMMFIRKLAVYNVIFGPGAFQVLQPIFTKKLDSLQSSIIHSIFLLWAIALGVKIFSSAEQAKDVSFSSCAAFQKTCSVSCQH